MFFQEPKLPNELILNILSRLPLKDAMNLLVVSREMNAIVKDDTIWRKFGAKNFENFVTRMKKLPENFRRYILKKQYNYTLPFAEDILRIKKLPRVQQIEALFTPQQVAAMPAGDTHITVLLNSGYYGIQALRERLLTPEQVAAMTTPHLSVLLNDDGIQALRDGLLTVEQASALPPLYLSRLLRDDSLLLREGLITLAQAAAMPNEGYFLMEEDEDLTWHISDPLLQALRERLITPEQMAAMPTSIHIDVLLDHLQDLREKLITPEEVAGIEGIEHIAGIAKYEYINLRIKKIILDHRTHELIQELAKRPRNV